MATDTFPNEDVDLALGLFGHKHGFATAGGELHEIPTEVAANVARNLISLLNSLEPLFESLESLETNVLANWGTELADNRVVTVDAGSVRKIKLMAGKLREMVE